MNPLFDDNWEEELDLFPRHTIKDSIKEDIIRLLQNREKEKEYPQTKKAYEVLEKVMKNLCEQ